ncbi:hypothetical protein AVEN_238729-1 [Araneus ventricosus]|uniref:Uncharacterized protein n=1 Tax=Araneus ventricosus TaxID=182803 RepID=A0A4Y2GJN7_ARAVE|nr:hypothetical protein AVEN_238729-1 [Araneus ventricosus]
MTVVDSKAAAVYTSSVTTNKAVNDSRRRHTGKWRKEYQRFVRFSKTISFIGIFQEFINTNKFQQVSLVVTRVSEAEDSKIDDVDDGGNRRIYLAEGFRIH